jgi:D5 N terminal like
MISNRALVGMDTSRLIQYEPELNKKINQEEFKQMKVRNGFVNEVTEKIKRTTLISKDSFTIDKNRIVVNNGILELNKVKTFDKKKGSDVEILDWNLTKHSPDHLVMNLFPVDYDPKATCPKFGKFLKEHARTTQDYLKI